MMRLSLSLTVDIGEALAEGMERMELESATELHEDEEELYTPQQMGFGS